MKEKQIASTNDRDRLFKLLLRCCRNRNKPDLHSFTIDIDGGCAWVECREQEVFMVFYRDGHKNAEWCGTPVAAANRLEKAGAKLETLDM